MPSGRIHFRQPRGAVPEGPDQTGLGKEGGGAECGKRCREIMFRAPQAKEWEAPQHRGAGARGSTERLYSSWSLISQQLCVARIRDHVGITLHQVKIHLFFCLQCDFKQTIYLSPSTRLDSDTFPCVTAEKTTRDSVCMHSSVQLSALHMGIWGRSRPWVQGALQNSCRPRCQAWTQCLLTQAIPGLSKW